ALLDAAAGRPGQLRAACALVEPRGEELAPVGFIRWKLEAFLREQGRGSLLVYHPDSHDEVEEFLPRFKSFWQVRTLRNLASEASQLLMPLFQAVELTAEDVEAAAMYLGELRRRHQYAPGLALA